MPEPTADFAQKLAKLPRTQIHHAAQAAQADAYMVEHEGEKIVIKCFAKRHWFVRNTIGRWAIKRETFVYGRLKGVEGIPKFYGRLPGPALAMQWLPVSRMPDQSKTTIPLEFFDELERLLQRIHEAGVAHADIRRTNVASDETGKPHLIDFASGITPKGSGPMSFLFRRMCLIDNITAVRLRRSYHPDVALTPEQQALLESEPGILKLGRLFRQKIYKPFRNRFIKKYNS